MLNLHTQNWLFAKRWPLLKNLLLLLQVIANNLGRSGLGHLGVQSHHVTNHYKKSNEAQQQFLEDLVLYTCKGYKPLSTCDNI
jgi:hypothetical protein